MATKKQVLVGFLMILTVLIMLFFITSDYSFSVSFSAKSHPLKIHDDRRGKNPKFFGSEDVEVVMYEGKEGQVIPSELEPKEEQPPKKVVVINTDDKLADEMANEEEWFASYGDEREFPQIDMGPTEMGSTTSAEVDTTPTNSSSTSTSAATSSSTSKSTPKTTLKTTPTTPTTNPGTDKQDVIKVRRDMGNMVHGTRGGSDVTTPHLATTPTTRTTPAVPAKKTTPQKTEKSAEIKITNSPVQNPNVLETSEVANSITETPSQNLSIPESSEQELPKPDSSQKTETKLTSTTEPRDTETNIPTTTRRDKSTKPATEKQKTESSVPETKSNASKSNSKNDSVPTTKSKSKTSNDTDYHDIYTGNDIDYHDIYNEDNMEIGDNDILPEEVLSEEEDDSDNFFVL